MPVPDFESLMLPALKALADGVETPLSEVRARIAAAEGLTSEDLREMLPGGRRPAFMYRVRGAVPDMARSRLVERVQRGVYRLTKDGKDKLTKAPDRIDMNDLRKIPVYAEWLKRTKLPSPKNGYALAQDGGSTDTPEEALDRAAQQLRGVLEADALDRVRNAVPAFLEQVVVDLLIAMGYGGGDAAMGRVTRRPGDGGIDGTIRKDALGLDEVYVQAKKHADGNTVGEGALRNFAGAIDAAGTTNGVFVITAGFTRAARDYVARSPKRIVLIDGDELARLMIAHDIGVRIRVRHEIKRIDEDYFDQEAV